MAIVRSAEGQAFDRGRTPRSGYGAVRVAPLTVLIWNSDVLGDPLAVFRVLRAADAELCAYRERRRRAWRSPAIAPGLACRSGLVYVHGGRASRPAPRSLNLRDVYEATATKVTGGELAHPVRRLRERRREAARRPGCGATSIGGC